MREYVPTTDEVRECWVMAEPSPDGYASAGFKFPDEAGMYAEFDAWLDGERAAARREGQAEAWDEAEWAFFAAHKQSHHEPWCYMPDNPYRQEVRHVDQ